LNFPCFILFHPGSQPQEQDEKAIVSLQDRIIQGTQTHEEGFAEWLRQRDQQAMVAGIDEVARNGGLLKG
jgi:hypothetical protein